MLNTKNTVFIIAVVFLVVTTVWFFRIEIKEIVYRTPNSPAIIFPEVQSRAIIIEDFDNKNVALEIGQFIPAGADKKVLWRLDYAGVDLNNTMGLELTYELNQEKLDLTEFYKEQINFIENNGWKLLATNLEQSRAFLDIQRKNSTADFKVHIFAEQIDNHTEVKVQYLIIRD